MRKCSNQRAAADQQVSDFVTSKHCSSIQIQMFPVFYILHQPKSTRSTLRLIVIIKIMKPSNTSSPPEALRNGLCSELILNVEEIHLGCSRYTKPGQRCISDSQI